MKPLQHARITAHRYVGCWQDWITIHDWIDRSKAIFPSMQHRMFLHSDFGEWLAVRIHGEAIGAEEGTVISTRDLFRDHQVEDLGRVVPLAEWLREIDADFWTRRREPPRHLEQIREEPAEGLAARWGGVPGDYLALIDFFNKPCEITPDNSDAAAILKMARVSLSGIFNRLARELPKVKTPWERILRDFLFRYARRKRRPDPSRPSRRWLALESDLREREDVDLPFERATSADRTGRIALAIDTSGSIDESLLRRFAAEVASVLEKTEPLLRLIVCDADVHQVHISGREGAKLLRGFEFKCGGGTDFRPAIAESVKWKPDLLIYLTDLEGYTGDEPAFPVLWAVPEGKAGPPWGKIVELR
jgi:VWA-like domain (DUF2201)/Domain of unknown function (DUF6915)/Putative metallopeptidase domain